MPEEHHEHPPLPELPPIHKKDVACIGPMMVLGLYRLFGGGPLNSRLIGTNPLLLTFLRGSFPSMIAAGAFARSGHWPLWLALIAPIPILMADDPFVYWAGRMYGRPLLNYMVGQSPALKRQLPRGERFFSRFQALAIIIANLPVNPLPMTTVVMFLAGETKMKFAWFLLVDAFSLLIFASFYVGLGYWIGKPAQDVATTISHYALPITLATVGLTLLYFVLAMRKSMRQMREQYGDDWMSRVDQKK